VVLVFVLPLGGGADRASGRAFDINKKKNFLHFSVQLM
jgi:hypothetical protein